MKSKPFKRERARQENFIPPINFFSFYESPHFNMDKIKTSGESERSATGNPELKCELSHSQRNRYRWREVEKKEKLTPKFSLYPNVAMVTAKCAVSPEMISIINRQRGSPNWSAGFFLRCFGGFVERWAAKERIYLKSW